MSESVLDHACEEATRLRFLDRLRYEAVAFLPVTAELCDVALDRDRFVALYQGSSTTIVDLAEDLCDGNLVRVRCADRSPRHCMGVVFDPFPVIVTHSQGIEDGPIVRSVARVRIERMKL